MNAQRVQDIANACARSAAEHERLCPRQVLGVRMGFAAADALAIALPVREKQLLLLAETDGCFVDGVGAATGCTVGHRTLRVYDYGRVAITAVDLLTRRAIRVSPRPDVRQRARELAPDEAHSWAAQLRAYELMPVEDLLNATPVLPTVDIDALVGRAERVECSRCGEEILNGRELWVGCEPVCVPCLQGAYYRLDASDAVVPVPSRQEETIHDDAGR